MRDILVIGDSNTEIDPNQKSGQCSWLIHAAKDFPKVKFRSYALQGSSHLYYDFVLKNCVPNSFSATIVQLTGPGRFLLPLSDQHNNEYWKQIQLEPNLFHHHFTPRHLKMQGRSFSVSHGDLPKTNLKIFRGSKLPELYTDLFVKSLKKIYSKIYSHLKYFSWDSGAKENNVSVDKSLLDFMMDMVGERQLIEKYMNHDFHLNYEGSKIAYYEYIKPFVFSKIL